MNDITVITLVRNEKFVFYALASVVPFVDKIIAIDTGSDDNTKEDILRLCDLSDFHKKVEVYVDRIPDISKWTIERLCSGQENHSWDLTRLYNKYAEKCDTKFIWIVDGDDVYFEDGVKQILSQLENWKNTTQWFQSINAVWFTKDFKHTFPAPYNPIGRIYKREEVRWVGQYPEITFYSLKEKKEVTTELVYDDYHGYYKLDSIPFCHVEHLIKPYRRKVDESLITEYTGKLPEVFYEYPEILQREGFKL